jgi:hypothetical protein
VGWGGMVFSVARVAVKWECEVECGTLGGWWGRGRRRVGRGRWEKGKYACMHHRMYSAMARFVMVEHFEVREIWYMICLASARRQNNYSRFTRLTVQW